MARQSGRTVRAILGVGPDILRDVEIWFWEAYDIVEPIGTDTLMIAKVVAALMKEPEPTKFMPYRYRNREMGELGSPEHQRQVAMKLQAFADLVTGMK